MMLTWRIYYGDGTTFSNADGEPDRAPVLNVQAVAQAAGIDIGRKILVGADYYWFEDGQWLSGDLFGLLDLLLRVGAVQFTGTDIDRRYQWRSSPSAEWRTVDLLLLYDALMLDGRVKFGRHVAQPAFDAAATKAATDLELPLKFAWHAAEPRP